MFTAETVDINHSHGLYTNHKNSVAPAGLSVRESAVRIEGDTTMTQPGTTDDSGMPFSLERIERMVGQFYDRVRDDDLLGPVFDSRIEDWDPHLARMVLFWRAILRSERVFTMSLRGGPPALHRSIDELSLSHFERWLSLFSEVVDDIYEAGPAAEVKQAAAGIGGALSRHLSIVNDD